MTAHAWIRVQDRRPKRSWPDALSPFDPAGPQPDTFWVRCRGCGAEVTTTADLFPGRCHEGWRMPSDCNETVVERIMEE